MLKRLLGLNEGFGSAAATLMLLGMGCTLIFFSSSALRDAAQLKPLERDCAEWIADPSGPRWLTLKGCKLDLSSTVFRRFSTRQSDAGVDHRFLELFVPLFTGDAVSDPPTAVLATQDAEILKFIDGISATPVEEVEQYLKDHAAESARLLEPPALTGYVARMQSFGARNALSQLTAEDAVVLQQGAQPERANAIFTLLVGLVFAALGVRTMAKRYLTWRELGSPAEGDQGEGEK